MNAVAPVVAVEAAPKAKAASGQSRQPPRFAHAKLSVGAENDPLEFEADRMADGLLAGRPTGLPTPPPPPPLGSLRTRSVGSSLRNGGRPAPRSVGVALAEAGRPLESGVRHDMEQRFGHDLSSVRVHCGPAADRSVHELRAHAYAAGSDLVFGAGRYAPWTQDGRRLLAHELAHVAQHTNAPYEAPKVMCFGRTFGGFLANIFQFWDYTKSTLDDYLKTLDQTHRIQGDDDSDDMARQIAAEWKADKSRYDLTPGRRILLVREMLDGVVSGADQDRIIDLLEGSLNAELVEMFKTSPDHLTYAEIADKFGSRKPRLELFNQRVLLPLDRLKQPDPAGDKSLQQRLSDVEAQQGISFANLSVSFRLAPGDLYRSFAVNLTVPEWGSYVTATLTRSQLSVRIEPSLLIDLVWPLSNSQFAGFTLTFAGLRPKLEIEGGLDLVSAKAQSEVESYLRGLLYGTRFAEPGYDPTRDPHLVGELFDPDVLGDLNRVRYNFQKSQDLERKGDGKDKPDLSKLVSDAAIYLNIVHQKGRPPPANGWGAVIEPGTPFQLAIYIQGRGDELMQKRARLQKLRITTSGIFIYKGKEKIAMVTGVEMDPGLNFKLEGVKAFVDLAALVRREYPGGLGDAASKVLDFLGQDVAVTLATKFAELWHLPGLVGGMLRESWDRIKGALGLTDQQLNDFFGLNVDQDQ